MAKDEGKARGGRGGRKSAPAARKAGGRKAGGQTAGRKGGARKAAARKGGARKGGARKAAGARKMAGGRKAAARKTARKTAGRKTAGGVARGGTRKSAGGARKTARGGARGAARGGARQTGQKGARGRAGVRRNVLWIESPDQHAERPGQTLATRNHDVIRQWAEERGAAPATVGGTEHGDRLGVLRFDFPFGDGSSGLERVEWDEWFATFDDRNLVFLYQERLRNGRQSNFFQLDNPDREDG